MLVGSQPLVGHGEQLASCSEDSVRGVLHICPGLAVRVPNYLIVWAGGRASLVAAAFTVHVCTSYTYTLELIGHNANLIGE